MSLDTKTAATKTSLIREYLAEHPTATVADVQRAHSTRDIQPHDFYNVKTQLRLKADAQKRQNKAKASQRQQAKTAAPQPQPQKPKTKSPKPQSYPATLEHQLQVPSDGMQLGLNSAVTNQRICNLVVSAEGLKLARPNTKNIEQLPVVPWELVFSTYNHVAVVAAYGK